MRRVFILIFIGYSIIVSAQNYSVSLMPDSIKKDADVVYRNSLLDFQILSDGEAVEKLTETKTILNKEGADKAYFVLYYNKTQKIKKLAAVLYDAKGKVVRKFREKDFEDVSAGGGLVTDTRMKIIDFHQSQFPYTVSLMYELELNGIVSYPKWEPMLSYNCGVEHVEFRISYPEDMEIQIKQLNYESQAAITVQKGVKTHIWSEDNLMAVRSEPYSPPSIEVLPSVWTAPVNFEYEGSTGSMASWKSFGLWQWELNKGLDVLPPETVQEIHQISDSLKDVRQKVKCLYEYMQAKTRYVNVSLGIGGWKPMPATKVDQTGYGDCKALSNYMRSILNVAGVESYYTKIGNGWQKIRFDDFASMGQSNHIILCVPDLTDSIWLECTSQTIPFGYISQSNSARKAVIVTSEGGKVVNTPVYPSEKNVQKRIAFVQLSEAGDAVADISTCYSGVQYENRRYVLGQNNEDQQKWLLNNLDFASADILKFDYSKTVMKEGLPFLDESLDVTLRKFSSKTGSRIFFPVMIMDRFESVPKSIKNRKNDVYKESGYVDLDSIHFAIPEGYRLEFFPKNDTIISEFGEYRMSFSETKDGLLMNRFLHMKEGRWPAERYEEMQDWYGDIRKMDKSKLVLVQNQ